MALRARFRHAAVWVAAVSACALLSAQVKTQAQLLQEGLRLLETRGDPRGASRLFEQAVRGPDRSVAARALLYSGVAAERLGQQRAREQYERVLQDYGDQAEVVREARRRLAMLAGTQVPGAPTLGLRRARPLPSNVAELGEVTRSGRTLAYIDVEGRVALADIQSGSVVEVMSPPDESVGPPLALSPDGKRAVIAREDGDELRIVEAGRAPRTVLRLRDGETATALLWFRGNRLLCQIESVDGSATLRILDVETGAATEWLHLAAAASRLALSPDATRVAFDGPGRAGPDSLDVFVATLPDGAPIRIAEDGAQPAWLPDGQLLFISSRTGTVGLWRMQLDSVSAPATPTLVQQDLGRVVSVLGAGPDAFHYLRQTGLVDVYIAPLASGGQVAAAPHRAASTYIGSNMGPGFSPDGGTVAFLAQMGFSNREVLGFREVHGERYRLVSTGLGYLRTPRWSPDGTRLLVKGRDRAGRFGFFVVDPRSGDAASILTVAPRHETDLGAGRWTSDGRSILYSTRRAGHESILRRDTDTGREEAVADYPSGTVLGQFRFEVSPVDQSLVLLQVRPSGGAVVVRRAGADQDVMRFDDSAPVVGVSWYPDGRSLLIERRAARPPRPGAEPGVSLLKLELPGGVPIPLGIEMPGLHMASISPDGRSVAFTAGAPTREIWTLEHFAESPSPAARTRR